MATLQQQIQQVQAEVKMLERLVSARRASVQDLEKARERLAGLTSPPAPLLKQERGATIAKATELLEEPDQSADAGRAVDQDEYLALQSELSKDADRLNRQMAELSNQLQKVPPGASCLELTKPILDLKAQIETIWDKKRYLDRNRCLPERRTADEPDQEPATEENSPVKFELAYQKRRLVDLRSKLKKKLENPAAKPGKVQEWRQELVQTNLEIAEIDIKLGTL